MKEGRILRRFREEPSAHDENISAVPGAPPESDSGETTANVADKRMPDFVFGVLRKQAIVPISRQDMQGRRDDTHSQAPYPISSRTDADHQVEASAGPDGAAGMSSERSASPASRAAPRLTKVSTHLFTSYALKARR
jgi:hypothetical protein